jgi:hypothetical protein
MLIGKSVTYASSDSELQARFWAQATNETGLWTLLWNADGADISSAFPVVLKSTAPVKPNKK